jgi:hypothetical protein
MVNSMEWEGEEDGEAHVIIKQAAASSSRQQAALLCAPKKSVPRVVATVGYEASYRPLNTPWHSDSKARDAPHGLAILEDTYRASCYTKSAS